MQQEKCKNDKWINKKSIINKASLEIGWNAYKNGAIPTPSSLVEAEIVLLKAISVSEDKSQMVEDTGSMQLSIDY